MRLTLLLLFFSIISFGQTNVKELVITGPAYDTTVSRGSNGDIRHNKNNGKYYFWNSETLAWEALSVTSGGTVTSVAQSFTGGLISVGGSPITGSGTLALTVAGTSGGIPYFSSSSTWASSAALSANSLVIGGGAGNAPSTTSTGTGVLTALGINVGSTGSFITQGGGQYWSTTGSTTITTPTVTGNPTFAGTVTINPAEASNAVVLGGVSNGTVFTSTNNSTNARLLNYQSPFAGSSTTGVKNFRIDGGNASTIYNETWSYVPNSILAANSNIRRTFLGKPGNDATGFVMGEFRDFKVYENTATPVITTGFEYANMAGGSSSAGLAVRFKLQGDKVAIGSDFTPDANLSVNGTGLFGGTAITAGSVVLDVQSISRMIGLPRVTNQAAITTPINGGIAYDGTTTKFIGYENGVMNNFVQVPTASNLTANRLLIASSGNVVTDNANFNVVSNRLLIGTATSYTVGNFQARVQVMGTSQSGASTTNMIFSNDAVAPAITLGKSRAASIGGLGIVQTDDEVGRLQFCADDGTDYQSNVARISAFIDATPGADNTGGRLEFRTTAGGANTTTERLRITSTGAWGLTGENYGTSGQVLTSNGSGSAPTWSTVTSVTNTAASNELMKSDGTNAVPSGLFNSTLGDLIMGGSSTSGSSRIIYSDGSGSNINISIQPKGTGGFSLVRTSTSSFIQMLGSSLATSKLEVFGGASHEFSLSSGSGSVDMVSNFIKRETTSYVPGIGSSIGFTIETSLNNLEIGATQSASASTLTGGSEDFDFKTKVMSSGAAASDRYAILGKLTTLTESTATTFVRITVPTGSVTGGEIIVTVHANDATDFQARTLKFNYSAVNKAGTITATLSAVTENAAASAGTLTATPTAVDAGSGNLDIRINAVSSLTQTTLQAQAHVIKNFGTGTISSQ